MSTELIGRKAFQVSTGGVWSYISASRINLWLRCPLAFKLRYHDGIRTPTTPSLFLGKVVHGGLEHWYRHRQLGVVLEAADVARRITESWEEAAANEGMAFQTPAEETALRNQSVDLVTAYLAQVSSDEPRPLAVESAVEAPLVDPVTGEDLGIPLVGVMDLVLDGQEGPRICDFKTSSRSGDPLEIAHEIQLSSYAYLLRHVSQQREAGLEIRSLIKTKTPKIEFHRYPARTEAHFRRLFAVVRAYLDAGRFVFRPGLGCSMCDFREDHCRTWTG